MSSFQTPLEVTHRMTAHQVQTGTFRKIAEQLQMVMTATHPVSLCLFHPHSFTKFILFSPYPALLVTPTISSGVTIDMECI